MSEDPIGFKSDDPNFYRYVKNRSSLLKDPTGLYAHPFDDGASTPEQRCYGRIQVAIQSCPQEMEQIKVSAACTAGACGAVAALTKTGIPGAKVCMKVLSPIIVGSKGLEAFSCINKKLDDAKESADCKAMANGRD